MSTCIPYASLTDNECRKSMDGIIAEMKRNMKDKVNTTIRHAQVTSMKSKSGAVVKTTSRAFKS